VQKCGWLALVIVGTTCLCGIVGCSTKTSEAESGPAPTLPPASEVAEIRAGLFVPTVGVDTLGPEEVPQIDREFDIPKSYVPSLMRIIGEPVSGWAKPYAAPICSLRIRAEDGATFDVRVVFMGKSPLTYFVNGIPCYRGGNHLPVRIDSDGYGHYLAEVYELRDLLEAIEVEDDRGASEAIRRFDQSAGRESPER
jgi:hypothetical protein